MSYMDKNVSWDFQQSGLDSYEEFKKILKKSPPDWIYRTKKITFNHNSLGFREKELDLVDWNNSIVILGCSHVYGDSIAEEDTAARVLEKQISMPVVNLGVCGGSVELAFYNSLVLYKMGVMPKAIIQNWTELDRYANFKQDTKTSQITSSHVDKRKYISQVDWSIKSLFYRLAFNAIWENKTFIYECSFFKHTASKFDIDLNKYVDFGRDNSHPGIISNKLLADKITDVLKLAFS